MPMSAHTMHPPLTKLRTWCPSRVASSLWLNMHVATTRMPWRCFGVWTTPSPPRWVPHVHFVSHRWMVSSPATGWHPWVASWHHADTQRPRCIPNLQNAPGRVRYLFSTGCLLQKYTVTACCHGKQTSSASTSENHTRQKQTHAQKYQNMLDRGMRGLTQGPMQPRSVRHSKDLYMSNALFLEKAAANSGQVQILDAVKASLSNPARAGLF
eukprot:359839-Chlamydomonas_euryale.AAC.9